MFQYLSDDIVSNNLQLQYDIITIVHSFLFIIIIVVVFIINSQSVSFKKMFDCLQGILKYYHFTHNLTIELVLF